MEFSPPANVMLCLELTPFPSLTNDAITYASDIAKERGDMIITIRNDL